jgi:hypothetical protein
MNYRLLNNNSFGFFSAQNPNKLDTPIMLWLQVGSDSSSLFSEIGPIYIDANGYMRNYME